MAALPIAAVVAETVLKIDALALGGAGVADVFAGRFPKNNQKKVTINVYAGDIDTSRHSGGVGVEFIEVPVHVHLRVTKTDTVMGADQAEVTTAYLWSIREALHLLRPDDLSAAISEFFLTEVDWDDTDTETGRSSSPARGVDKTVEGFLTVRWQFWRSM